MPHKVVWAEVEHCAERRNGIIQTTREAILAAVTSDEPEDWKEQNDRDRVANRAVALKAVLPEAEKELSSGEKTLLSEWLDRLS